MLFPILPPPPPMQAVEKTKVPLSLNSMECVRLDFSKVTAANARYCPPFITGQSDGADEEDGARSDVEDGDILKQRSSPTTYSPSTIADEFFTIKPFRHRFSISDRFLV
ncbi:hypothetical protein L2E82_51646 [Cichorium intybus]|nr:hypothetical protein L2E82_51646 [Cichorium intybus]